MDNTKINPSQGMFSIEEFIDPTTKQKCYVRSSSAPPSLHFDTNPEGREVRRVISGRWVTPTQAIIAISKYSIPDDIQIENLEALNQLTTKDLFFSHSKERIITITPNPPKPIQRRTQSAAAILSQTPSPSSQNTISSGRLSKASNFETISED